MRPGTRVLLVEDDRSISGTPGEGSTFTLILPKKS